MASLIARVRRAAKMAFGNAQDDLRLSNLESLVTTMLEPPGVDGTRANFRYMLGNNAAITGIAPVQALPTTTAQWAIQNNEPAGGKTYYFEELGVYLTAGTPGVAGILLACIYTTPLTAVAANTAGVSVSPCGKAMTGAATGSSGSNAQIKSSPATITSPAAPAWFPVASNPSPNVTAFAGSVYLEHRNIQGRIALPPQTALGLVVVSPAGTMPLFAPFGQWLELPTDND